MVTQGNLHAHKGGELLIKFKPFADPAVIAQIGQTYGKEIKELKTKGDIKKLIIKDQLNLDSALLEIKQINTAVEWVEPNYLLTKTANTVQALPTPNDPNFSAQWALENTGQSSGTPAADVRAKAGWASTTGSRSTIVAVIDTGADLNHSDLKNNLWVNQKETNGNKNKDDDGNGFVDDEFGWNFVNDTPNPQDDHGHGTVMAGLIAAEGNNAAGIAGVMWQGAVMPLKALDASGSGYVSDVVDALDYAIASNVSVINCSFGTAANSQALSDAIARTASAGILVVTSSGNNGQDLQNSPQYPASYTLNNLITVGATTNLDDLAPFSNYGAAVHVGAPGVGLISTQLGGGYSLNTGTSGSAALVAGVAGLLKTQRGWVSGFAIRQAILDSVRTVPQLNGKVSTKGVVNLGGSIATLLATGNPGSGGGNNGGGGNGGGNNGGGSGGGTTSNGMNLDLMRANTPVKPDPKVYINNLPAPGYDDPAGGSGTASYFVSQNLPKNEVGAADGDPTEPTDPTGGGQTGATSINLGSQNINFAAPVLSLSGRAGLGLDLAMNYNSKVWMKDTATSKIVFNSDKGYPAPGWRIGFGAIEGKNNSGAVGPFLGTTGNLSYTYIEPDGSRHELNSGVNSGSPTIFTSFDSTYIEFDSSSKKLRFMNGTCVTFGSTSVNDFLFLPTQIKDRNGNFITIQNQTQSNNNVVIDYIIDTLGRYIDFFYENDRLTRVRELRTANNQNVTSWLSVPIGDPTWYNYLIIDWQPVTVSVSFSGLTTDPTTINGTQVFMPARLDYPSGHSYKCFYNSYVQMYLVEKWNPTITGQGAARRVAYTRYDQPSMNATSYPAGAVVAPTVYTTAQTDCPKFANRWEWAENWNLTAGVPQEVNYQYSFDLAANFSTVTDPQGRIYRTDLNPGSNPQDVVSRTYTNATTYNLGAGTSLKTITTRYIKDTGPTYVSNQRVSQVTITDGSFSRKTAIAYTSVSGAALPMDSDEYDAAGINVYRRTHTDYNTSTDYSTRHIIGLPSSSKVYSGAGVTLLAQVNYAYDEGYLFLNSSVDNVIQSDVSTGNPAGSLNGNSAVGRGNLTTTTQYSVSGGVASSPRTVGQRPVYDSQGNVRGVYDVNNNLVAYEMWDNYSNKPAGAGETHAFPTRIIELSLYQSGAKFDWFTGNVLENYHIQGASQSGTHQNVVTYNYDFADRRIAELRPDGGYTTYNFWDNWMAVATYTLIEGTNKSYSYKNYDGAGRTIRQGGDLADGVATKFTATNIEYDNVGRGKRTTNPTAVNGNFVPIDDDVALGFQWTTTTYDALDRPTQVMHPDSDSVDYSYVGCGCAGSSTVLVDDERGKKRKTVKDHLGRLKEAYDLTSIGANTYSRVAYSYTPLDQMTTIAHYDNGIVKHQDRTFAYDGYGRLTSQTTPEAGTTGYTYTALDQVLTATLANSSTRTFTYNTRGLVSDITYNGTLTQNVHYEYNNEYGARTLMQEKNPSSGAVESSTTYAYNAFVQLQTETRSFKGLTGTYSVGYQYNLAGGVKTMTYTANTFVKNVNYAYNAVGGLSGIGTNIRSGGAANDTTNVMSGFQYRGFGAVKQVNYGNGKQLKASYDAKRLQMTYLSVHAASNENDKIVSLDYNYYNGGSNNGRVQKITDYLDGAYTATYAYDDQNRLASATAIAYTRGYAYDAWANFTGVTATGGGELSSYSLSYATNGSGAPLNNRISNAGQSYDNAGNMAVDLNGQVYSYDAANRIKSVTGNKFMEYDGDGHRVLSDESAIGNTKLWYLWSTVLGQPVVELGSTGGVYRAYVYSPGGQQVAQQSYDTGFHWTHSNHLGSGYKMTDSTGAVVFREEFDPHGQTALRVSNNGPFYLSHKFTGYERDLGTNTDYAKARQYHHNNGRFMQADPLSLGASDLSNPQSLNLYSYVKNDPVNYIDPEGLNLIAPDYWERIESSHGVGGGNGIFSPGIHSISSTSVSTRTGFNFIGSPIEWGSWVTTISYFAFGGGGGSAKGGGGGGTSGGGSTQSPMMPTSMGPLPAKQEKFNKRQDCYASANRERANALRVLQHAEYATAKTYGTSTKIEIGVGGVVGGIQGYRSGGIKTGVRGFGWGAVGTLAAETLYSYLGAFVDNRAEYQRIFDKFRAANDKCNEGVSAEDIK